MIVLFAIMFLTLGWIIGLFLGKFCENISFAILVWLTMCAITYLGSFALFDYLLTR